MHWRGGEPFIVPAEIAVASILIRKFGKSAAQDFIDFGIMEAVRGMEAYQQTAREMGREPYSNAEIDSAKNIHDEIIADKGDLKGRSSWAFRYVGANRFDKLQKAAGLEKWKNDYKWASQNVHTNYREMRVLLGMAEATEDGLLAGPSDSAFTDPAQFSVIALAQTTSSFITCYIDEENCPIDYTLSSAALKTINYLTDEIGERFLKIERQQ